jgi:hypothetical protein
MAGVKTGKWQMILLVGVVLLLIAWVVTGHFITGIGALILLLAMAGGALLYRFQGPPER